MDDYFGFADAFAGGFDQAAWAERGLENENSVTAAGFRFDERARGLAADLFVGRPHEYDALGNSSLHFLQGFESKESLDNACLHVKGTGAVHLVTSHAIGHFDDGSGGVHGVVMAQDEELRPGGSDAGRPDDAKMIAAMLLANHLN